ncbi:MAG: Cell shape-determining protein MreC [Patescibacteria group bacterium]|nr:Cell shape-determining protein MreC [Patescibacteria group bacterium]
MTYRSARSKDKGKHIKTSVLVFCVLILSLFWKPTQDFLYPVFSPVLSTYVAIRDTGTGIPHAVIAYFTDRNTYENKITNLEEQIEYLENELAYAHVLTDSFEEGIPLDTGTTTELNTLSGGLSTLKLYPIIKDKTTIYNTILVSGGFDDGIEEGMVVYVRGYEAVGYIAKVHKSSSVVNLFSSGNEEINGVIKDIDTSLILFGDGGGAYRIEAPKSVDLAVGQKVFLAENQSMILGTIVEVTDDPQDTFTRAYVRGAYNPNRAHIFYVDSK